MQSVQETYGAEALHVEPHGTEPISAKERHGKPRSLFTLWFSANLEFATLTLGLLAVGVFGLSFQEAAIATVIGIVAGALLIGLFSTFGFKWGVPQLIQSRAAFGFFGNFLPGITNFLSCIGWYTVNTVLSVYALQYLLPIGFLPDLIIMIVLQAVISIYGYNLIHSVERWSAILLAIVFIIVTFYAFPHINFHVAENIKTVTIFGGTFASFILAVGVALSYTIAWATYSSDYSRYLPVNSSKKKVFGYVVLGNIIPCIWLELLGIGLSTFRSTIAKPTDLIAGILPGPIAVLVMLAIILGTITANVLNIYSGSMSLLSIDTKLVRFIAPKRWIAALLVGVLGGILSYIGFQTNYATNFSDFLLVLGYWICPFLAVVLCDYLFIRHNQTDTSVFYRGSSSIKAGFWAFLIGFAVSVPFFNQTMYVGFIAKAYPAIGDLSYYVSFVVAFILYFFFTGSPRKKSLAA
ncbi:MAG: cytosine permease [Sporolactobacillus sp.]